MLPKNTVRVLVTAEPDVIRERFAKRMKGNLPASVALMLEKKHGMFDNEQCDIHVNGTDMPLEAVCASIVNCVK